MPALRCSIPIGPASRDVRCGRGWKLKLGNMLLLKGRRSVWNAMGEVNVYIVSAHKSLDPAAGAGFLAARRPRVACGCL